MVGQTNERFVATYQLVAQAVLTSIPEGLKIEFDGGTCTTPCLVEKDAGVAITVSPAVVRDIDEGTRLVFRGWGDSSEAVRSITLSGPARTYTAVYIRQNRLSVSAAPAEGASLVVTPSSADGFYDEGTLVSVAVKLGLGFRIAGWTGDIPGSGTSVAVTLNAPQAGIVRLDRAPAIAPSGVRSAATGAPFDSVAPGD